MGTAIAACLLFCCLPAMATAMDAKLTAPGAPDTLTKELRGASATLAASDGTAQEVLAAALADYRTLLQILYDRGYFSPVIRIKLDGREAGSIPATIPPDSIETAEIEVATGPVFRFGTVRIAPLAPGTELPPEFTGGQTATTSSIRGALAAGVQGWREAGHAKAQSRRQSITADHRRARLNAEIDLDPGPRLSFGNLIVGGESKVSDAAVRRIAGLPKGETFDPDAISRSAARLRRTGSFASVTLTEAETPNPDGTLDISAALTDLPPRRISLGGEIQSRDGITLSAAWLHRNLFGNAERFRIEGEVRNIGGIEDIDGRIAFRLDRPDRLGPDDSLFYLGSIETIDARHYDLDIAMLGIGVRRIYADDLTGEIALEISTTDARDAYGDRSLDHLRLPISLTRDRRDIPNNASRGTYVSASLTPFVGLGGAASGMAAYVDGRGYVSLTENGALVLAGRLQIGSTVGAQAAELSPDLLYFSGGAGTVRGQPYQSLGIPVGANTGGGRALLAASAELRARIRPNLSLVGFFDYGAIDDDFFVTSGADSHSGAGIGVRYDLGGFGPIRLDLAVPVNGDTDDGLQFYFGIGQAF